MMSRRIVNLALLVLLVGGLWLVAHLSAGDPAIAAPASTLQYLVLLAGSARFWENLKATMMAFALAGAITVAGGVALGVVFGMSRFARETIEPIVTMIYSLPKITLYPVILLIFGFGLSSKVALGVLHGIVPIILFTMGAIAQINPVYIRSGRAMSLSLWKRIVHIYVPAALPGIASGLRVGLSLTLFGTLIGEMFASQNGLGALLMASIETAQVKTILALALVLSVFAIGMNGLLLRLDRQLRAGRE
jgi:NitT/TauT family transport system permease protein